MYKVLKIEEFFFNTLEESAAKINELHKITELYRYKTNLVEVANHSDDGIVVIKDGLVSFQWFRDFIDNFDGYVYIGSYKNPVIVNAYLDRIELLTNDEDRESEDFCGLKIKGKDIFTIYENAEIVMNKHNSYYIWLGNFSINVTFIKEDA